MNKFIYKYIFQLILIQLLFFYTSNISAANIKNSAVVYMYHKFGENNYPTTNITIEQFEMHMDELSKEKYNVVPLNFIVDSLIAGVDLPINTVAITIDDGYKSFKEEAWPRFRKYNFPVTLFVTTDYHDANNQNYLSWDEIRQLKREGVTIGAHTKTHPKLQELSVEEIKHEIEYSNKRFLEEINELPELFAYSYGETSTEVIEILKDYKFKAMFGQHSGVINETSNLAYLPRFSLNERYGNIDRFKFIASAKGMGVYDLTPSNPLLTENPPFIGFSLLDETLSKHINCFIYDSDGNIEKEVFTFAERIEIRLKRKLSSGRVRMNCTAKKEDGHWRWFGQQFILPNYLN